MTIPEPLRSSLKVGDALLVTCDRVGRIVLTPKARVPDILERTAGIWKDRDDIPSDGVEYVNQLRQGNRLQDLVGIPNDSHGQGT